MSGTVFRRNTSKQGLHKLLRLTAQRSIEDAEETERERRRRAREAARSRSGGADSGDTPQNSVPQSKSSTPQSVLQSESSTPQSVLQSESSTPQSVLQSQSSTPQSVLQSDNSIPQSVPQSDNSIPQSVPQSDNSIPQSEDNMPQSEDQAPSNKERVLDAGLKPGLKPGFPAILEEDEGFSDWTLKLGGNHQHHPAEKSPGGAPSPDGNLLYPEYPPSRLQQEEEENKDECEMKESERSREQKQREREEVKEEESTDLQKEEQDAQKKEEKDKKKQTKVIYVSSIFLHHEKRYIISNGDPAGEEMTSRTVTTKRAQRSPSAVEEVDRSPSAVEEVDRSPSAVEEVDRSPSVVEEVEQEKEVEGKRGVMWSAHGEKERKEQEYLWRENLEAEAELEELRKRREERQRAREEDKRQRKEEEHRLQMQEEENRRQIKAKMERRRMDAADKMKSLSITEEDGPFSTASPKSPTFKNETEERVTAENTSSIIERTESLNRSLKKHMKTLPPVFVSTIDDRLKQYTHALETSRREGRQTLTAIPHSPEPVASKKSLFEAGDAWSQGTTKSPQHKDADGLRAGVAGLIFHWVKGSPESCSRKALSKPSSVRAGDVLYKKNLWESVRASSSGESAGKACDKRYTYVVTGHGKYEKMPVNSNDHE